MTRELVFAKTEAEGQACLASVLFEDGKAVDFALEAAGEPSLLGNIYLGKVEKIQESIGAAFVRLGAVGNGYLPLHPRNEYLRANRKEGPLKVGDELLVQVEKEAMKEKLPRLSASLLLSGRYLVLSSDPGGCHFSKRLSEEEKKRLAEELLSLQRADGRDLIVRTNAAEASLPELAAEFADLQQNMERILAERYSRSVFSCLQSEEEKAEKTLRDSFGKGLDRVVTDDAALYARLKKYLEEGRAEKNPELLLYDDKLVSLWQVKSLSSLLANLQRKRVWLSSGAYLVIEQTAAFVCIDVNTGKIEKKQGTKETFRAVNLEAAGEILRQLRLRRLSGTILVDFINMEEAADRRELLDAMRELAKADPTRTVIVDFTELGIMEITRQKVVRSLAEEIARLREQGEEKYE